jgi:hypothetical protein
MAKFRKKASGPSDSGISETLGGSKAGGEARFGRVSGAPDHSNVAAARSEGMKPSGYGGASDASELDVYEDHGNQPGLFRHGLPADTRGAKEV